jgi:NAD(P)-dependent dehydrogenase (short-subunit alcohol dehydrogenase family)
MKKDIFSVNNLVVVITGSGRGIGLELAIALINNGAKVIRLDKKLKKINKYQFQDFTVDLSNPKFINTILTKIKKRFKQIDVLINNAGISIKSNKPYNQKILEKTLSVNLIAAYNLSNQVCKMMSRKKKGSIINITSLGAELGFEKNPSYQVSKAGLKQLSKALACDWGHKNIRINNICPGYLKTSMTNKSFKNQVLKQKRDARMILKRWGTPNDLVGPCIFLASDASSYITGIDLIVDGGWLAKGL